MRKSDYRLNLKKDEKGIINILNSDAYIESTPLHKIKNIYLIDHVQDKLHELLNSFLNGGFSSKGFIFYPLIKGISKNNKVKIRGLSRILNYLNSKNYNFSNSIIELKKANKINSKNFAVIVSSIYNDFSKIKKGKTKIVVKKKCNIINFSKYKKSDESLIKPLKDLKKFADENLKQYVSGFYLHGSFSTLDYIKGWSDVDTLLIIKKDTINSPERLLKLRDLLYISRKFFYNIDPLQHHGFMIITEYDLEYYCQTYFPIEIFKYSKSFFMNDAAIKIKTRNCKIESINSFFFFVNYFRTIKQKKSFNPYDLKFLLHIVTLFPTVYLQAKGKHMYKKFSFNMAKKDFEKNIWASINTVSSLRKKWVIPNNFPLTGIISIINPLLAYQINSRYWGIFHNISKINNIDTKNLISNMHGLSEKALKRIKAL